MRARWLSGFCGVLLLTDPVFAQQSIKIGVAAPFSGSLASFGTPIFAGARTAAETINAAGGIDGRRIEIVPFDDAGHPAQAAAIAQRMAAERINFAIGHATNITSLAAADAYAAAGILQIELRAAPERPNRRPSWNLLRICGPDRERGSVLADYLRRQLNVTTVGVVHEDSAFGRAMENQLRSGLGAAGMTPVAAEEVATPENVPDAVRRVQQRGAGAIVLNLTNIAAVNFSAVRSQASNARVFIDWTTPEAFTLRDQPQPNAGGPYILQEIDQMVGSQVPAALNQWRNLGVFASNGAVLAFAAVQVITQGLARVRSEEPQRVSDWVRSGQSIPTILGDLRFTPSGEARVPRFAIYGVGPGRFRPNGTEVTCDKGCACKDGGCSNDCCPR
jgi:branched-chain amino acid transport system substrate-binding protein